MTPNFHIVPFSLTGLNLILFLESSKYIYELTANVGARIVVHDQDFKVFPDDEGSDLPPGMSTSISVQKVKHYIKVH